MTTQAQTMRQDAQKLADLSNQQLHNPVYLKTLIDSNVHYQLSVVDKSQQVIAGAELSAIPKLSQLTSSGNVFRYAVKLNNGEILVLSQQEEPIVAGAKRFFQRSLIVTLVIAVFFVVFMVAAAKVLIKQVELLRQQLRLMATKDFTQPQLMHSNDEFGSIETAANETRLDLEKVLITQGKMTQELQTVADQMTICMDETKEATQEEFAQVDQLATAMSEVAATVNDVANNAEQAATAAQQANELASQGNHDVNASIQTINQLADNISRSSDSVQAVEQRVNEIGSVVETINSISEQTNLLALNAAIEAARAGEYGRGFAVVADEVRNLAKSTQNATVEIHSMIAQLRESAGLASQMMEESVQYAQRSVEQVSNAGDELNQIVQQVSQITQMNTLIATASEQQREVTREMDENLIQLKDLIKASVTVIDELYETSQVLSSHGQGLGQMAAEFRLDSRTES
ncbi:methyl-accepting chemotaxis protein [Celerinatantimonas diazotrophica]|nr:methyl-accepting chemotaxis protein [Celerinatantimonas diazotrophica]